jgi:hypothetical protein
LYLSPGWGAWLQYQGGDDTRGMSITVVADGVNENTFAGAMNILVDGLYQRGVYCVDWDTFVNQSDYAAGLGYPDIVTNGTRVAWLLENTLATVINNQAKHAALQLAIWDIVHDNGDGMTAGRLRYSQANLLDEVLVTTNDLLALSLNQSSMNAVVYTHVSGRTVTQQFMGAWPTSGPSPIPEPGTWALGAAALMGLWLQKGTFRGGRSTVETPGN